MEESNGFVVVDDDVVVARQKLPLLVDHLPLESDVHQLPFRF